MEKMYLPDGLQSLQMVKKAKHLTFSQNNLDLFSKESYLPYCQAWQDKPLEDVEKLNPQGFLQETKSCTAEGPVSDDCGTEHVLWCHTHREGATTPAAKTRWWGR